jgi:hypothetical protein
MSSCYVYVPGNYLHTPFLWLQYLCVLIGRVSFRVCVCVCVEAGLQLSVDKVAWSLHM